VQEDRPFALELLERGVHALPAQAQPIGEVSPRELEDQLDAPADGMFVQTMRTVERSLRRWSGQSATDAAADSYGSRLCGNAAKRMSAAGSAVR